MRVRSRSLAHPLSPRLAALFTLGVTLMGFFYQIPSMIRGVYQAKLNVMQRDRQPLWVTWTASQE